MKFAILKETANGKRIQPQNIVILAAGVIIALVLIFSSMYFLGSNEEAVITLFGKHVRTETTAGLKFKWPLIEKRTKVDVEQIRRMEFGYRTVGGKTEDVTSEARMLTGDENIVVADWAVLYKVNDSYKYLFNVDNQVGTLRTITEAAYRRVVAAHTLDEILTDKKDSIQMEVKDSLEAICRKYDFGVTITAVQLQDAMPPEQVKAAFLDVSSAKEEKNAKINEARKYENEKLPIARGQAEQIMNEAEGYKQQRINEASGDASRFTAILTEYKKNTAVTRTRLYLEAVRTVLPSVKEIYIMNDNGDVLKFLPVSDSK